VVWVEGAVGRLGRSRGGVGEEWRREDEWAQSRLSGTVVGAAERGAGPGGNESGEVRVVRGRAWADPRRKRGGRAQMNSKVLHLFELV
jgi:hypothetical protein